MRRRVLYIVGLALFFGTLIGVPLAYKYFTVPPTCSDGKQNQGETAPDRGGQCPRVDANTLAPSSILWARAFRVRDGSYTATSYIENPNDHAGVLHAPYIFRLYDQDNVLIAERAGETYVMPGGITPVLESAIGTGHRIVAHTFFQFTRPLTWEHYDDASVAITVNDRSLESADTSPRLEARADNTSVKNYLNVSFVAVIFDTAGNAFAVSATRLDRLEAGQSAPIVFAWPQPFAMQAGRIDIIPLLPPVPAWTKAD